MKKYNCPYCKVELSSNWDELLKKNNAICVSDFLFCGDCKKEYKLFVIKDKYLQVVGITKHEFGQEMHYQKVQMQQYQQAVKNDSNYPRPVAYKTYLRCISNAYLNQEFELCKVVRIAEPIPGEALFNVYHRSATGIFNKYKYLNKIELLGYVMSANDLPLLFIQTIRNKPHTINISHAGFTIFDQSITKPFTYYDAINVDIARQEVPFLFPEFGNLGFQAINF